MASEYSPLATAATSIMQGRAQAKQLGMEALMYGRQAEDVDLQSTQASERRREQLRATISAITADRAQKNVSLDSPTAIAIEREIRRQSVRDEGAERVGFNNQSYALRTTAAMRRRGATNAKLMGYLNGAGSIMDAVGNVASMRGGGGGGSVASKAIQGGAK